jgi:hypothetical protein
VVRVNTPSSCCSHCSVGGQLPLSAGQAGVTLITEFTKACVLQSVLESLLGRYTLQEHVCIS